MIFFHPPFFSFNFVKSTIPVRNAMGFLSIKPFWFYLFMFRPVVRNSAAQVVSICFVLDAKVCILVIYRRMVLTAVNAIIVYKSLKTSKLHLQNCEDHSFLHFFFLQFIWFISSTKINVYLFNSYQHLFFSVFVRIHLNDFILSDKKKNGEPGMVFLQVPNTLAYLWCL